MASKFNFKTLLQGFFVLWCAIWLDGRTDAAPNNKEKDNSMSESKLNAGFHNGSKTTSCGGTFDTTPGVINHPVTQGGYYNSNEICTWIISSSLPLEFYFSKFNMEADHDHVSIRDGGSIGSSLIADLTGKSLHYNFTTEGDAYVQFESDPSVVGTGFVLHWRVYSAENQCKDKNGFCVQTGDRCKSTFKLIQNSCDDHCACCQHDEGIIDNFSVTLKTGYGKDAGTTSRAQMVFVDQYDNQIRNYLSLPIQDETAVHRIYIPKSFGRIVTLRLALDNSNESSTDWYCEDIFVDDPRIDERLYFPIDRRIQSNLWYEFQNYATSLPQFEPDLSGRELTLLNKIKHYEFTYRLTAAMVNELPDDDIFHPEYFSRLAALQVSSKRDQLPLLGAYQSSKNISTFYGGEFYLPESFKFWKEDAWFGAQRIQGVVPNIIEVCHKIPEKLGMTEGTVAGLLEGSTLKEALENNKIFITNLDILDGIHYKNNTDHASPIAIFYLNKINQLMPIAIQLKQEKGSNNPIYTPKDPPNTWLVAKLYYNNAEAQFHQVVTHFGYTHLIMDGIATSMHRQLAPSHPIFKILKPHFLYLLANNKVGEERFFVPGGVLDFFSIGHLGLKDLAAKAIPLFTFTRAIGSVESDARARGVWDKQVLPYYPFRDDAHNIYNIVRKYVTTIMTQYYDTPRKVSDDWELQRWRAELSRPRGQRGVGIPDLPGSNTAGFHGIAEIIDLVTMIITHNSVGHAAVNFGQYDTYGYFPNYPADIKEGPPLQKRLYTEDELMSLFPDKKRMVPIRAAALLLSWQGTNDCGDFERTYLYDPVSREAQVELTKDLNEFSMEVMNRNRNRLFPYKYLDPNYVPNSIAI